MYKTHYFMEYSFVLKIRIYRGYIAFVHKVDLRQNTSAAFIKPLFQQKAINISDPKPVGNAVFQRRRYSRTLRPRSLQLARAAAPPGNASRQIIHVVVPYCRASEPVL